MIFTLAVLAGAIGAVARFVVDGAIKARWSTSFPFATVVINVSGSFLLGVLAGLVTFHAAPTAWQTILGTGFCGGYTTFSTASYETLRLIEQRRSWSALVNAAGTLVAGVAACALGMVVAWGV